MPNPGSFTGRVLNESTNQGKEHDRGGGEKNSTNTPGFCKGLMSAKTIFWAGLKYEMGNGKEIRFWGDSLAYEGKLKHTLLALL